MLQQVKRVVKKKEPREKEKGGGGHLQQKVQQRIARALNVARWCLDPEKSDDRRPRRDAKHLIRRAALAALTCLMPPVRAELVVTALTRRLKPGSFQSFHADLTRAADVRRRLKRRRIMKSNNKENDTLHRRRRRRHRAEEDHDEREAALEDDDDGEEDERDEMSERESESDERKQIPPIGITTAAAAADDDSDSDDIMIVEEVSSEAAAARLKQQSSSTAMTTLTGALKRRRRRRGGSGFDDDDEGIGEAAETLGLRLKSERGYGNCMFCAASSGFNSWLDLKRTLDRATSAAAAAAFGFEGIIGWADLR